MNEPGGTEFDRYAKDYTNLHRANVRASGEEPSYFSRYKALYMGRELGHDLAKCPLSVLDFGCGVGNSIPYLREAFPAATLHGVDPSIESIRVARETHAGEATFCGGDGLTIPYGDSCFDLIQVACVFHHIQPEQRIHWMREVHRVLKPRGAVFVFEHNLLNPLTIKAVRDCPFDEDAILLPRREALDLVRSAGFTAIRARYIVFFPAPLACLRPLERWLGRVPFGAQYVVRAVA